MVLNFINGGAAINIFQCKIILRFMSLIQVNLILNENKIINNKIKNGTNSFLVKKL